MNRLEEWIMKSTKNKIVAIVTVLAIFCGVVVLTSFTTVKLSLNDISGSNGKADIAKEIVGQLSEQYLTPKFDAINTQLNTLQGDVGDIKDWTAKKDDKECRAFVKLLEKQYEKYNKDKLDIKTADLKEIDEGWGDLPDKYKTAMIITYYKTAMDYYATIKK